MDLPESKVLMEELKSSLLKAGYDCFDEVTIKYFINIEMATVSTNEECSSGDEASDHASPSGTVVLATDIELLEDQVVDDAFDSAAAHINDYANEYKCLFRKCKIIPPGCLIWRQFRPITDDTLYSRIFLRPADTMNIVNDMIDIFLISTEAVSELFRLFLDVSGYQRYSFEKIFKHAYSNYSGVIQTLNNITNMDAEIKGGKVYVFMETTRAAKVLQAGVCYFVQDLIVKSYQMNLFDDRYLLSHIIKLFKAMLDSESPSIKHTGVVLVMKAITALTIVKETVIKNEYDKELLSRTIDYLYPHDCPVEKRFYLTRVAHAKEIFNWIHFSPVEYLVDRECLFYIIKHLKDPIKDVKMAALNTCDKLVQGDKYYTALLRAKPNLERLTKEIFDLTFDIYPDIVVKALSVLLHQMMLYPDHILSCYVNRIFQLFHTTNNADIEDMSEDFLLVAADQIRDLAALSEFFAEVFTLPYTDLPEDEVAGPMAVVQFCSHYINTIKSLDPELLSDTLNDSIWRIYEQVLRYSLSVGLREGNLYMDDGYRLVNYWLLPHFRRLVVFSLQDNDLVVELVSVLKNINYEKLDRRIARHFVNSLFNTLVELLDRFVNKSIVTLITDVLSILCDPKVSNHDAETMEAALKTNYTVQISSFNMSETNLNAWIRLGQVCGRMAIAFKKFNFTSHIDWNDLYKFVRLEDVIEYTIFALPCCQWHLIWTIKETIKSPENSIGGANNEAIIALRTKILEFLRACLQIMKRFTQKDGTFIRNLAFRCLTDFIQNVHSQLADHQSFSKFLSIRLDEESSKTIFFPNFVPILVNPEGIPTSSEQDFVIELLSDSRLNFADCLHKYITLISIGAISFRFISNVFFFYHTDIFDGHLNDIISQIKGFQYALPVAVTSTMNLIYRTISSTLSDSIKERLFVILKRLAKKLAKTDALAEYPNENLYIVQVGICHATYSHQHHRLLLVLRYFAKNLSDVDKYNTGVLFVKMLPDDYSKSRPIGKFLRVLDTSSADKRSSST